jgi:hypothetical protein
VAPSPLAPPAVAPLVATPSVAAPSVAKKPDRTVRRTYACNGKVARFTIAKKRYVIRCTKSMQVKRIVVEGPNAIVTYVLTRARKR